MGRGHGATRGGGAGNAYGGYKRSAFYDTSFGKQSLEKALELTMMSPVFRQIKDPEVAAELRGAVEQYAKEIGFVDPQMIRIDTMPKGRLGYHQGSDIVLSKDMYNRKYSTVESRLRERIDKGLMVDVKRPVSKTLIHEMAHVTHSGLSPSAQKTIQATYDKFMSDKSAKGWGNYARKNVKEFYAEGIAKSMLGQADQYTHALRLATQGG